MAFMDEEKLLKKGEKMRIKIQIQSLSTEPVDWTVCVCVCFHLSTIYSTGNICWVSEWWPVCCHANGSSCQRGSCKNDKWFLLEGL